MLRTKPTADVSSVQNLTEVSTGKTYKFKSGKKLLEEI
jgi:hypothetical protein